MVYLRNFFTRMERYYKFIVEKDLASRHNPSISFKGDQSVRNNELGGFEALKAKRHEIEELSDEIYRRMEESGEDKYQDIIDEVHDFDDTNLSLSQGNSRSNFTRSVKIPLKRGNTLQEKKNYNSRSRLSVTFTTIWRRYVHTIATRRNTRLLVDKEHFELANLMFKTLTNKKSHQLMIQSYKTFISTSIDYVFSCDKANWNLYIIVFIFKINSMLLILCDKEMKKSGVSDIKTMIEANILDSVDTLRTSSMIFKILSSSKDDNF